jgi:hypothetical protein
MNSNDQATATAAPKGKKKRKRRSKDTIAGYFRRMFEENPKLLDARSNKELLERWHRDHPKYAKIPENVKTGLANVKSLMRKLKREGKLGRKTAVAPAAAPAPAPADFVPSTDNPLEPLEIRIDECINLARSLDADRLERVIKVLLHARRQVVWLMGE